jgi:hypothetical protein
MTKIPLFWPSFVVYKNFSFDSYLMNNNKQEKVTINQYEKNPCYEYF